jgi:uncharacterized protein YndB with AHSA1/START domain
MTTTRIDTRPGLPFIDMTREFAAPRELVYRAHMDPELLAQWIGPRRLTTTVVRYDVRDGGTWRFVQRDEDGSEYAFHGVFHGDPSPEGFVQTFEFEGAPGHVSLDAVTLEEHDGRTTLRVHSVFQTVEARDAMVSAGMETGVQEGYERLDELFERVLAPAR